MPPPGRGGDQLIPRPPGALLGDPPPWAGLGAQITIEDLLAIADPDRPGHPEPPFANGKPPSAVLVPVYDTPEGPELLFTRRAWHLRSHAGQIAFPGGRKEAADADLVETALRETGEEIGLDPDAVEVVGELDRLSTVTSPANIVPILGRLEGRPRDLTISDHEVDDVVFVPVAELLDARIYREEIWFRDVGPGGAFEGVPITFFELVGDTLWGATARIVRSMLERVVVGR